VTQPVGTGNVLAGAATALALIALESQTRQQVQGTVDSAFTTIGAVGVTTASTAPATVLTGIALLSLATLHNTIVSSLAVANNKVRAAIQSGYTSAAHTTFAKLAAELGDDAPTALPELGDNLDRLVADVDTMFGHAQTDLQNGIAGAFDGVQGPNPTAARIVAIKQAVENSQARTTQRAQAAAGNSVQQGATDAEQAIFNQYQQNTGIPGLLKRWVVTSNNPCGMCDALDGALVGINGEFDHSASTNEKDYRRVWRNLLGPPRHPNCRCRLELIVT
jgi:hypothetical protein